MGEAGGDDNTPNWCREPYDLVRLLHHAGYVGQWPDSPRVDGLAWPDVVALISSHPAMQAIEKLYRLPPGLRPPPLWLGRVRPAELKSWLRRAYSANDQRRHCWFLQGDRLVVYDFPGTGLTVTSVLEWYREQIVWCLLLPVIDQLQNGDLVGEEANSDGPLLGSPPAESRYWIDPRMVLDLRTGAFWPQPRTVHPPAEAGWLRSYSGLRLRVRAAVRDIAGPPTSEERPQPLNRAVRAWLRERVLTWPDDKPAPSEAKCFEALTQHFQPGLSRHDFRIVREQETPTVWRKQGRRPRWGKVKLAANLPIRRPQN